MQKYVLKAIAAGLFSLLAGCQAGTSGALGDVFNPYHAPRQTLAQSVQEALSRSEDPVVGQVRADMRQKTIVLSGYVKKIRQSDTAEQIAHQVPGVQLVENNIIVRQ